MGMPGMTDAAVAGYAAAKPAEETRRMTVAEFRNGLNPVTGYYDQWDIGQFLTDQSIAVEKKLEVLFGKFIGETVSKYTAEILPALTAAFMKKKEN